MTKHPREVIHLELLLVRLDLERMKSITQPLLHQSLKDLEGRLYAMLSPFSFSLLETL